ncbi:M24 family metallopeptidase [Protaetiibacter mangrovi]|uniref:M24 family metallopeptidase n=1 Tax=Protaetiibacter mangrovi TaxID=2970926 RepID=A0ABT1ZH07_9MICO|nr:M24 family metallopeptidase [Protaetiibacter mangrovi]MCS0499977.1 M24 family metallopeptidase [Protaetiibacter mangrovi]TPX04157.1 M24 family metallopeptidase [Schumannella luteola]
MTSSSAAVGDDRPAKLARVRELLADRDAPFLTLTAAENLAWLLDGARVQVPYGGPPVVRAVVDRDGGIRVDASANEVDRLAAEELGGLELHPVPWSVSLPDPAPGGLLDTDLVAELRAARAVLLPAERARYASLGAEVARAVGEVLRAARPGDTERRLAAELARAVVGIGAEPVVLLVAGESRLGWRHPLPTDAPLGRRAIAVVGARRTGLVVNLTRWIRFGSATPSARAGDAALLEVEADAFAATRPGRTLAEALADIRDAYPRHGFDPEEWTRHHQGGPTGYLGRDPKATPDAADVIRAGQAFAWNPSAPGAKVEDTVIVDDGIRVLTVDPGWPTTMVRGLARPIELEL